MNNVNLKNTLDDFITRTTLVDLSDIGPLYLYRCDYNLMAYRTEFFSELEIIFPDNLNKAVIKRQSEYLAGRYAAKMALAQLSSDSYEVPTGKHRSPVWPANTIGSLTHTSTTAFCAVGPANKVDFVGIDFENWLPDKTVTSVKSSIISEREELFLQRQSMSFNHAFTLTFSAKESLFKALYPMVGYYFDFSAAEILFISENKRTFKLVLTQTLTPELTEGMSFTGSYHPESGAILTIITKSGTIS